MLFLLSLAEVKQNEISLLFLIDIFEKIVDQHEYMLEFIEDI